MYGRIYTSIERSPVSVEETEQWLDRQLMCSYKPADSKPKLLSRSSCRVSVDGACGLGRRRGRNGGDTGKRQERELDGHMYVCMQQWHEPNPLSPIHTRTHTHTHTDTDTDTHTCNLPTHTHTHTPCWHFPSFVIGVVNLHVKSFIGFHGNIYHQGGDVWPIQCLITGLKGQLQEAHRRGWNSANQNKTTLKLYRFHSSLTSSNHHCSFSTVLAFFPC